MATKRKATKRKTTKRKTTRRKSASDVIKADVTTKQETATQVDATDFGDSPYTSTTLAALEHAQTASVRAIMCTYAASELHADDAIEDHPPHLPCILCRKHVDAMFDMLDDVLCFIEVSNGKPDADDGVAVQFNTDQCIAEIRAAARVARRLREIMKGAAQ